MSDIADYMNIDYDKISISDMKELNGKLYSKINYNKDNFIIKGSSMIIRNLEINNDVLEKITFEFTHDSQEFYQFFFDLNSFICDYLHENSLNIFGTKIPETRIKDLFRNNILLPTTLQDYPKIILKCDTIPNVYNIHEEQIDYKSLQEDTIVNIDINFDKIIYYKNKFCLEPLIYNIKKSSSIPQLKDYNSESSLSPIANSSSQ